MHPNVDVASLTTARGREVSIHSSALVARAIFVNAGYHGTDPRQLFMEDARYMDERTCARKLFVLVFAVSYYQRNDLEMWN